MTPAEFRKAYGRDPQMDDLHRANCDNAGQVGHMQCGVCFEHKRPRFMCGCLALPEADEVKPENMREMRIDVGIHNGSVVVDFNRSLEWFAMTKESALELARNIRETAESIKGGSHA